MKITLLVTKFLAASSAFGQSTQDLLDQCSENLSQASVYDMSESMKAVRRRYGNSAGIISMDEVATSGGPLRLLSESDYRKLVDREAKRFGATVKYESGRSEAYSTTTAVLANVTKEGPSESARYIRVGDTIYITQIHFNNKSCGVWYTSPKKS